jgi:hypothetical protein
VALTIPNKGLLGIKNPRLGEALNAIEQYVDENVTPRPGTKKKISIAGVDPSRPPG